MSKKDCKLKSLFKNPLFTKVLVSVGALLLLMVVFFLFFNTKNNNKIWNFVPAETTQVIYINSQNEFLRSIINQNKIENNSGFQYIAENVDEALLGQIISGDVSKSQTFVIAKISKNINFDKVKDFLKKNETDGLVLKNLSKDLFVYGDEDIIDKIKNIDKENFFSVNTGLNKYLPSGSNPKDFFFTIKVTPELGKLANVPSMQYIQGLDYIVLEGNLDDKGGKASFHIVYSDMIASILDSLSSQYKFNTDVNLLGKFGKNAILGLELASTLKQDKNLQNTIKMLLTSKYNDINLLSEKDYEDIGSLFLDNFFVGLYNSEKESLPVGLRIIFPKQIETLWSKLNKTIQNIIKAEKPNISLTDIDTDSQKGFVINLQGNPISGQNILPQSLSIPVVMTISDQNSMLSVGFPENIDWGNLKVNTKTNTIFGFSLNPKNSYNLLSKFAMTNLMIHNKLDKEVVVPPLPKYFDGKMLKGMVNLNKGEISIDLELN